MSRAAQLKSQTVLHAAGDTGLWTVTAIKDWRYSASEHAAVALLGGKLRPDVVEVVWEGEPAGKSKSGRPRQERSWEPISNLTGGYASPMVQQFLTAKFLPKQPAPALAPSSAPVASAAAPSAERKRKSRTSKPPASKRVKALAAFSPVEQTELAQRSATEPATNGAVMVRTGSTETLSRLLVQRENSAAIEPAAHSSSSHAESAREQIKKICLAAAEVDLTPDDLKFFEQLVNITWPPVPHSSRSQTPPASAAGEDTGMVTAEADAAVEGAAADEPPHRVASRVTRASSSHSKLSATQLQSAARSLSLNTQITQLLPQ